MTIWVSKCDKALMQNLCKPCNAVLVKKSEYDPKKICLCLCHSKKK